MPTPVVSSSSNNQGIVGSIIAGPASEGPAPPLVSTLLPAAYEKMAEMVGGYAASVDDPAEIRPAIERALASDRVALINAVVDTEGGTRRGGGYL